MLKGGWVFYKCIKTGTNPFTPESCVDLRIRHYSIHLEEGLDPASSYTADESKRFWDF